MKIHELFEAERPSLARLIAQHCPKNFSMLLNKGVPILWRGVDPWPSTIEQHTENGFTYGVFPRRKESRESQSYSPLVMKWLDTHPSWSGFPRRSMSQMASTSYDTARNFGDAYIVVPFDNAGPYGYSREDINLTEINGYNVMRLGKDFASSMHTLVHLSMQLGGSTVNKLPAEQAKKIQELRTAIAFTTLATSANGEHHSKLTGFSSLDRIKQFCDSFDNSVGLLQALVKSPDFSQFSEDLQWTIQESLRDVSGVSAWHGKLLKIDKPLFEQLESFLSPKSLKAQVTLNLPGVDRSAGEVWFDGDCLLIRASTFDSSAEFSVEILDALSKFSANPAPKPTPKSSVRRSTKVN